MSAKLNESGAAPCDVTVSDARGRSIVLSKPKFMEKIAFDKAVGASMGSTFNLLHIANVSHLAYVRSIDGVVVPIPNSETAVNALLERLDYAGNEAVQKAVFKHFTPKDAEAELDQDVVKK